MCVDPRKNMLFNPQESIDFNGNTGPFVQKMSMKVFFACAVLSGLSLGCFETLIYIASGIKNLELRLLTAVVIHSCCAGLSGLFVFNLKNGSLKIYPFVLAVFLHGIYNYFAGFKMDSMFF